MDINCFSVVLEFSILSANLTVDYKMSQDLKMINNFLMASANARSVEDLHLKRQSSTASPLLQCSATDGEHDRTRASSMCTRNVWNRIGGESTNQRQRSSKHPLRQTESHGPFRDPPFMTDSCAYDFSGINLDGFDNSVEQQRQQHSLSSSTPQRAKTSHSYCGVVKSEHNFLPANKGQLGPSVQPQWLRRRNDILTKMRQCEEMVHNSTKQEPESINEEALRKREKCTSTTLSRSASTFDNIWCRNYLYSEPVNVQEILALTERRRGPVSIKQVDPSASLNSPAHDVSDSQSQNEPAMCTGDEQEQKHKIDTNCHVRQVHCEPDTRGSGNPQSNTTTRTTQAEEMLPCSTPELIKQQKCRNGKKILLYEPDSFRFNRVQRPEIQVVDSLPASALRARQTCTSECQAPPLYFNYNFFDGGQIFNSDVDGEIRFPIDELQFPTQCVIQNNSICDSVRRQPGDTQPSRRHNEAETNAGSDRDVPHSQLQHPILRRLHHRAECDRRAVDARMKLLRGFRSRVISRSSGVEEATANAGVGNDPDVDRRTAAAITDGALIGAKDKNKKRTGKHFGVYSPFRRSKDEIGSASKFLIDGRTSDEQGPQIHSSGSKHLLIKNIHNNNTSMKSLLAHCYDGRIDQGGMNLSEIPFCHQSSPQQNKHQNQDHRNDHSNAAASSNLSFRPPPVYNHLICSLHNTATFHSVDGRTPLPHKRCFVNHK